MDNEVWLCMKAQGGHIRKIKRKQRETDSETGGVGLQITLAQQFAHKEGCF